MRTENDSSTSFQLIKNHKFLIFVFFSILCFVLFWITNYGVFSKKKPNLEKELAQEKEEKQVLLKQIKESEDEIKKIKQSNQDLEEKIKELEDEIKKIKQKNQDLEEKKREIFLTNPDFEFDTLFSQYQNPYVTYDERDLKFFEEPNHGKQPKITKENISDTQIDYYIHYDPFVLDAPHFLDESSFNTFISIEKKRYNQVIDKEKGKVYFNYSDIMLGKISFLYDFSFSKAPLCKQSIRLSNYGKPTENIKHFDKLVVANTEWADEFQHWIDHVGCFLMQIRPFIKDKGWTIFVKKPRDEIIYKFYDFIKKDFNVEIIDETYSDSIHADYFLFPCGIPSEHPRKLPELKQFLLKSILETDNFDEYRDPDPQKIVYISRVNNHNGRNLLNQEEVINYLEKRFKDRLVIFSHKDYPDLKDLVKFFSSAKLTIGLHGGAFYNIIFSLSNPMMIEFHQPRYVSTNGATFWLAHTTGCEYWKVFGNSQGNNMTIDLETLETVLNDALQENYLSK
ncbi:beta-12-xylosyltransferase [Anaeramoeba ignava]|uniref:Beta-12-xylosyltransferase n=1 Tax=Anaeramoeba ignava TaxID=1746090 RepID=A0A9Q0LM83_ANAIG|nr:beta-12-xylosyltransferase [Anaeramoeba ignava]